MEELPSKKSSFLHLSPLKLAWFILFASLIILILWLTYSPSASHSEKVVRVAEKALPTPSSRPQEESEALSEIEYLLPLPEETPSQEILTPSKALEAQEEMLVATEETTSPQPAPPTLEIKEETPAVVPSPTPLAWQLYAQNLVAPPKKPIISIVINGLGMSSKSTEQALNTLPPEVTLAFLPYATSVRDLIAKARLKGHEVMLALPMEPLRYPQQDPGPYTLLSTLSTEENVRRLQWLLEQGKEYVGVTNLMGSKLLSEESALKPLFNILKARGLIFLENHSLSSSKASQVAAALKDDLYLNATISLDTEASRLAIGQQLERLEQTAKVHGYAIGVGVGYEVTLKQIKEWAQTLKGKGITLVPITVSLRTLLHASLKQPS